MRGHLTEKADVFGFGVLALEILSGRPNSDNSLDREKIYLLEWVKKNNNILLFFLLVLPQTSINFYTPTLLRKHVLIPLTGMELARKQPISRAGGSNTE